MKTQSAEYNANKDKDIRSKHSDDYSLTNNHSIFTLIAIFACSILYLYVIYLSFPQLEE